MKKARLQQQREGEPACAHEEAETRAAEATAAAMEEAKRKIRREMPPRGSQVDTLRRFLDGDPTPGHRWTWKRKTLGAAKAAAPPPVPAARAKGRTRRDHRGLPKGIPITPTPSLPAVMGMDETAGIATSTRAARWERPESVAEEARTPLRAPLGKVHKLPTAVWRALPADPGRNPNPNGETWTSTMTWSSTRMPFYPASEDPPMADRLDPRAEDRPGDRREEGHPVDPHTEGHQTGDPLEDHEVETPPDEPPGAGIPEDIWRWIMYLKRRIWERPQQREAPPNRRGPTPPRPTILQLCPYMVAARLMALL